MNFIGWWHGNLLMTEQKVALATNLFIVSNCKKKASPDRCHIFDKLIGTNTGNEPASNEQDYMYFI